MTNLDKFIEECEGRLKKATPGPWEVAQDTTSDNELFPVGINGPTFAIFQDAESELTDDDAEFIASAPTDIAKLLEIVKVLRQDLKSIVNIDHGKVKNLAEASLEQANAIAGEGE